MKYFASFLLLAASLTTTAAFAQETLPSESLDVSARIVPPVAPTERAAAAEVATSLADSAAVELTGYVLDEQKRPLRGATVLLKGTTTATSTDATGHYSLPVPPGINTLLYDYVGRESRQVAASNFLPVTVVLAPANGKARGRR